MTQTKPRAGANQRGGGKQIRVGGGAPNLKHSPPPVQRSPTALRPAGLAVARPWALKPDGEQIATFVGALFKHAKAGTFVSLRSFPDKGETSTKPYAIAPVKLNGRLDGLIALKRLHHRFKGNILIGQGLEGGRTNPA